MEKISNAITYVYDHEINKETINDACNIFADCYEEYMILWHYLTDHFSEYELD